jgi:hypothetical protein
MVHALKAFCTEWGLAAARRVPHARVVCVWRGDWVEAEKELVKATDELVSARPAMGGEGQSRLGELRRQGRLAEAEKLFNQADRIRWRSSGAPRSRSIATIPPRAAELAIDCCGVRRSTTDGARGRARGDREGSDRDRRARQARTAAAELASIAAEMSTLRCARRHPRPRAGSPRCRVTRKSAPEVRGRDRRVTRAARRSRRRKSGWSSRPRSSGAARPTRRWRKSDTSVEAFSTLRAERELARAQRVDERLRAPSRRVAASQAGCRAARSRSSSSSRKAGATPHRRAPLHQRSHRAPPRREHPRQARRAIAIRDRRARRLARLLVEMTPVK